MICFSLVLNYYYNKDVIMVNSKGILSKHYKKTCLPVWAEVDLKAVAHNVRALKRIISPGTRLMVVVKADAYGHGMLEIARQATQNGAQALGVARITEAISLRKAGFDVPVLIFGYTPYSCAEKLVEFELTQTVYSYKTAKMLSETAASQGKKINVHIKIDTGMGRLGFPAGSSRLSAPFFSNAVLKNILSEVESIARLKNLNLEGIFTHFAAADSTDKTYTEKQFEIFLDFLSILKKRGLDIPVKHAANSAAVLEMHKTHLSMVRAGILVYGLSPFDYVNKSYVGFKPAMALKSRVTHLKKVPAGFKISYGITYETKNPTTIATVSIGYGDGLNRLLSSSGHMLVGGHKAPIAGRVCMDMTMLDVGHIESNIGIEDEVVIFGRQGDLSITIDEIASNIRTINYEILTSIRSNMPRIYLR